MSTIRELLSNFKTLSKQAVNSKSIPDIRDDVLAEFKRLNTACQFLCAYHGCQRGSDGFASRRELSNHRPMHGPSFVCSVGSCQYSVIGFKTSSGMRQHTQKYHITSASLPRTLRRTQRAVLGLSQVHIGFTDSQPDSRAPDTFRLESSTRNAVSGPSNNSNGSQLQAALDQTDGLIEVGLTHTFPSLNKEQKMSEMIIEVQSTTPRPAAIQGMAQNTRQMMINKIQEVKQFIARIDQCIKQFFVMTNDEEHTKRYIKQRILLSYNFISKTPILPWSKIQLLRWKHWNDC